jgi:hypothetical protein
MALTTVTLTQDMRPWRKGDDIHIDPKLAEHLVKRGEAKDPRPFVAPNAPVAPVRPQKAPERPILHLGRKARR